MRCKRRASGAEGAGVHQFDRLAGDAYGASNSLHTCTCHGQCRVNVMQQEELATATFVACMNFAYDCDAKLQFDVAGQRHA